MAEPLSLTFQADTAKASGAIADLAGVVTTNMVKISNSMRSAYDDTSKFKTFLNLIPNEIKLAAGAFVAFGAAVIAFKAVTSAIEEAQEKLKELVAVGQGARTAGVGTDLFQRWTSHATELNTTAEKLAATLNNARDAAEVSIGEGGEKNQSPIQARLEEHLKAGNISQGDINAFDAAKSLEDRYRVILNLLEKLTSESKTIAALDIAGKFFGKDFEAQMRRGEDVVGKMRASLNGITQAKWPPEMIQRAEDLNKEIERAKQGINDAFMPLQRDVAKGQLNLIQYTKEWWEFLERVAKTAASIYQWFTDIGTKLDNILNSDFFKRINAIQTLIDKAGELGAKAGAALGLRNEQYDPDLMGEYGPGGSGAPRKLPDITTTGDATKALPSKKTTAEETKELDTLMDQLKKSVAVLEAENQAYGKNNVEKQKAIDLAKAEEAARRDADNGKRTSAKLTDEETQAVLKLAEAEGRAKDRAEELRRATEQANARANFFGEQVLSVFDKIGQNGVRARDVILDIAKAIEKAALQALILGQGPLAGLFGTMGTQGNTGGLAGLLLGGGKSLFGGGFGGGESLAAGELGTAGPGFAEAAAAASVLDGGGWAGSGPRTMVPAAMFRNARHFLSGGGIPSILHPGEIVLNAAQQKNVAGNMGMGPINLTHAPVINGTGLSAEQVFSVVQRSQKEFARQIGPIFNDWQRRHG